MSFLSVRESVRESTLEIRLAQQSSIGAPVGAGRSQNLLGGTLCIYSWYIYVPVWDPFWLFSGPFVAVLGPFW